LAAPQFNGEAFDHDLAQWGQRILAEEFELHG
jgi:hypothetical protein